MLFLCTPILKGNVRKEPESLMEQKCFLEMEFLHEAAKKSSVAYANWSMSLGVMGETNMLSMYQDY